MRAPRRRTHPVLLAALLLLLHGRPATLRETPSYPSPSSSASSPASPPRSAAAAAVGGCGFASAAALFRHRTAAGTFSRLDRAAALANTRAATSPALAPGVGTGLIGDGAPALFPDGANPYSRGSPYGAAHTDENSIGTGTYSGYGYGPMGPVVGFGQYPTATAMDRIEAGPGFSQTAWNYSSPWGDSLHPGVHPMWPMPPSPLGPRENDPRMYDPAMRPGAPGAPPLGWQDWQTSGHSNATRYGIQGANSFSPYRRYRYDLGQIPATRAWMYAGRPGGEPIPFQHQGIIPAMWPEGRRQNPQELARDGVLGFGYGNIHGLGAAGQAGSRGVGAVLGGVAGGNVGADLPYIPGTRPATLPVAAGEGMQFFLELGETSVLQNQQSAYAKKRNTLRRRWRQRFARVWVP